MAGRTRTAAGPGSDLLVVLVTFAVLGVVGAVLWSIVVTPAEVTKVAGGAAMSENQLGKAFGADGWFVVLGVAGALLTAAVLTWWRSADPLRILVLVVLGAVLAAVLTAWLGYLLGPDDPRSALASAKVGSTLPTAMRLGGRELHPLGTYVQDTLGFYLAWPMGALAGVLIALLGRSSPSGNAVDEGAPGWAESR